MPYSMRSVFYFSEGVRFRRFGMRISRSNGLRALSLSCVRFADSIACAIVFVCRALCKEKNTRAHTYYPDTLPVQA